MNECVLCRSYRQQIRRAEVAKDWENVKSLKELYCMHLTIAHPPQPSREQVRAAFGAWND